MLALLTNLLSRDQTNSTEIRTVYHLRSEAVATCSKSTQPRKAELSLDPPFRKDRGWAHGHFEKKWIALRPSPDD